MIADREAERARSILRDTERAKRKIKRAYRIDCPQCDGTGKIHMDDQKRILRQIDEKLNVSRMTLAGVWAVFSKDPSAIRADRLIRSRHSRTRGSTLTGTASGRSDAR